jgi:queuine/archaeosine tRNA-ribosyltransferase
MTRCSFEVLERDASSHARSGVLRVGKIVVRTPALWFGYSLRSRLRLPEALDLNAHPVMLSYGDVADRHWQRSALVAVGAHTYVGHAGPILMDSGGFKFAKGSGPGASVEDVIQFYERAGVDLGVALDYPLSARLSRRTNRRRWTRSLTNYRVALELADKVPIMPVVHGLTLKHILEACDDIAQVTPEPLSVGLGSMVPLLRRFHTRGAFRYRRRDGSLGDQTSFMADAIQLLRECFPRSLLHVFGVGGTTSVISTFALGADSVDSVAWRTKAGYGAIMLPGTSDRFLAERPLSCRKRITVGVAERALLDMCKCPVCRTSRSTEQRIRRLEALFSARAVHNAWVLKQEVDNFRDAAERHDTSWYLQRLVRPGHRLFSAIAHLHSNH